MFSKYSEEAQSILINARWEMKNLDHPNVGSEHLFLSLLKLDHTFSNKMKEYGITYSAFKEKLINMVGTFNTKPLYTYTPLLKRILETAMFISKENGSSEVGSEHLIYSIFEENEGVAIHILDELDVDTKEIENYYFSIISKKKSTKKKLLIEEFGIDLTKKASLGLLDPVIGRDNEIKMIMEILCRRNKNNPLLVGEAGVGKTAIVEELARLIVNKQVPDILMNKKIISVSLASLVAGTKYRGEFEERITRMLKEIEEDKNIYLFIDEIHTIMGAGGAEGAIDAANIFKPALSRGNIKLIGATTLNEYRKSIEKDKAMERRFQKVMIEEPTSDDTLNILNNIFPIYEKYHNVKI